MRRGVRKKTEQDLFLSAAACGGQRLGLVEDNYLDGEKVLILDFFFFGLA